MIQNRISTLQSVSKALQEKQEEILEVWIQEKVVIDILEIHGIDKESFKNDYAREILKYYFAVVNEEKEIGDCPVIVAFLEMLKKHDVAADALFDIYTYARKSMISISFDMGIASKELFRDISYVFDLNFKGVLARYSTTVYRLEKEVQAHIEENKKKDAVMFHQARLAQMGEMISNIAHQWRQPISMISAIVQNTHLKHVLGKLDDDLFEKNTEEVKKILGQMSQTITDFQNFFQPNKEKERFRIEDSITKALELVTTDFKKADINIIRFHYTVAEDVLGFPNEFAQTVLNIFSNAKDALIEKNEPSNRNLYIKTKLENNKIIITIRDNAGGIPEDVIEKVFNPYFTTKEEGKGTGIGLYMSSQIVTNMGGSISVENLKLFSNTSGAKFTIELPIC